MNFSEALSGFRNKLRGDEGAARLYGTGLILSQLGAGQTPNAGPALQLLQERKSSNALRQSMSGGGAYMDRFTPDEQAFLSTLPPQAAQQLIAQRIFAAPSQGTDDMREFEYAQSQGYAGSFAEWQSAKTPTTTVNVGPTGVDYGDPGDGLAWKRENGEIVLDERGVPVAIPYQGGSVWRDQNETVIDRATDAIEAAENASDKTDLEARAGNVVIEDIGRLEDIVRNAPWYSPATGFGSGWLEGVRGSNAANAAELASTIKGNIGFDRLQQMRDASPTGGALGQVSQQELATLQSVLGSLSQAQSEEQLLENLERLEVIYTDIMSKAAAYPNAAEFGFGGGGGTVSTTRLVYDPITGELK